MKRFPIFLFAMIFSMAAFAEPANLGLQKIELEHYYSSGRYFEDISSRIREAQYYLRFRITQNKRLPRPKKLAIVLDIDETSLSNYEDLKRLQFGGSKEELEAANADSDDSAINPTLDLYHYAIKNNVAVFFVSGRKEFERKNTTTNLHKAGFTTWKKLLLEPNNYNKSSVIPFKTSTRKKIVDMGYDIVLDVGDQYSDLKGGYADMFIKLPNPFYYLP